MGRGSTFVVELPAVHDTVTTEDAGESSHDATGHAQHVLIVDDNEDSANALKVLLGMSGHSCRIAFDGSSALLPGDTFRPSVGIIDIGLPDMSGFDVAVALRKRFVGRPLTLIALSGYSTAEFHRDAAEAGFDHYFAKPVPVDQLFDLIGAGRSIV